MKINKQQSFSELLRIFPEAEEFLLKKGMHCIGCPMAQIEKIEQGALAHGLNPDNLVLELNKLINKKNGK